MREKGVPIPIGFHFGSDSAKNIHGESLEANRSQAFPSTINAFPLSKDSSRSSCSSSGRAAVELL